MARICQECKTRPVSAKPHSKFCDECVEELKALLDRIITVRKPSIIFDRKDGVLD